jgi:tetratricopeptide (TPR) repeat protein
MARETVESLCQRAKQAITSGQLDPARQFYVQALGLRSDVPDVHYGLATVCFLMQDYVSAAHHFKEVTRLDPLHAGAHINLGAVYNRLDRLDEAIPVLRRGIQLDVSRSEGYYNLGVVYRRKGQIDLAIAAYREATRLNPRMYDAHLNLGNLYYERQQFSMAVAHYRTAVELRPDWEKAQLSLEQAEEQVELARGEAQHAAEPQPVAVGSRAGRKLDPDRMVDPQEHGPLLNTLHNATIESENQGRGLLKLLLTEVEPAIKDLSNALLQTDHSANELDDCVTKFEKAVANARGAQQTLSRSVDRVRTIGEQLLRS